MAEFSLGMESALRTLLGGVSTKTFFQDYFGRSALHISGTMRGRQLFSWRQLNTILNNHKTLPAGVKILADGKESVPADYLVLLRDVRRGLTMFFEDIDRFDQTLSRFLITMSDELQSPTRFNLYLSSPGKQGRKLHYDTHDVFVLQIEGKKRWQIYRLTDPSPIYTRKNHEADPPDEAVPYLDCTLNAGDVLYLPRGHWHNVNPLDDLSLHLTLGIFIPNGIEFLLWLVDECTEVEGARENIPLRAAFETDDEYLRARDTYFARMIDILAARGRAERTAADYESFCVASLPNRAPFNFPYSTARSEVMPVPAARLKAKELGAKIVAGKPASIVYSNRTITIPTGLLMAAQTMLSGLPFSTEAMSHDVAPELKGELETLVRAFVAEGLVAPE